MKEKAAHGGTGKKGKDGIGRWDVYQVYEKKEIVTTSNNASDAEKQVAVEEPKETMQDGRHDSPDDSEVKT